MQPRQQRRNRFSLRRPLLDDVDDAGTPRSDVAAHLCAQPGMRCPTGGDEFCGDAHGIVDRNGETQTVRFERSIDMVTAIRLSLGSIQ